MSCRSQSAPSALRVLVRPPMLALHLIVLLTVVAMAVAGLWQLGVYGDARRDDRAAVLASPPVPLEDVLGADQALTSQALETRVVATGRYAGMGTQFVVRGRELGGRGGYWVLSPLLVDAAAQAVAGGQSALLVVRGWQDTPKPPPVPDGEVTVTGVLKPGEEPGTSVEAGRVVDSVRISALLNAVPFDLYSGYLIRTAEQPAPADRLAPVTPPTTGGSWTTGLRNLAYGLQWWLFAGFALFMWWRICLEQLVRRGAGPPGPEAARR